MDPKSLISSTFIRSTSNYTIPPPSLILIFIPLLSSLYPPPLQTLQLVPYSNYKSLSSKQNVVHRDSSLFSFVKLFIPIARQDSELITDAVLSHHENDSYLLHISSLTSIRACLTSVVLFPGMDSYCSSQIITSHLSIH